MQIVVSPVRRPVRPLPAFRGELFAQALARPAPLGPGCRSPSRPLTAPTVRAARLPFFSRAEHMLNALTVDVEDYFQVSAFERCIPRSDWDRWESRVVTNTRRMLALFAERGVRGTFFVLGWVAEKYPALVREIDAGGHEIGSHSYWHRLIYQQTADEFRADVRRSKATLEAIVGRQVTLYRAPSFSITPQSRWALDVLAEEGFRIDASIFPVRHDRYGMRDAPCEPHVYDLPAGRVEEFPASVLSMAGCRLPASGGGYFRLYPLALTLAAARQSNRRGRPFMFYIHPWEIDPDQPRVPGVGWKSRLRHYINLSRVERKLARLLAALPFGTLTEALRKAPQQVAAARSVGGIARPTPSDRPVAVAEPTNA
jgi:polysaccharide deacetylase family protein (PEP-CTERM system associated)